MSHVSKIELEITDLAALKAACTTMNLEFLEGKKEYKWYGVLVNPEKTPLPDGLTENDLGKCDHAIRSPECDYEIGVVRHNGKWLLLADFWYRGGLKKVVGKNGGLLKQAYAVERIKSEARRKGYRLNQRKTENGLRLTLTA